MGTYESPGSTHIIFRYKGEESAKGLGKVRAQSFGQSSYKITSRRNKDGIIFSLVLGGFVVFILIGILLTKRLLFEDLDSNATNGVEF